MSICVSMQALMLHREDTRAQRVKPALGTSGRHQHQLQTGTQGQRTHVQSYVQESECSTGWRHRTHARTDLWWSHKALALTPTCCFTAGAMRPSLPQVAVSTDSDLLLYDDCCGAIRPCCITTGAYQERGVEPETGGISMQG